MARDLTTLIPPRDSVPRKVRLGLVLQMRRLLKRLVVVDAEGSGAGGIGIVEENAADLRPEEARTRMPEHRIGRYTVCLRDSHLDAEAVNLGLLPLDREGERCVQHDVEVVVAIGVLPEVLAVHDQGLAEALLEAGVVLAASCGLHSRAPDPPPPPPPLPASPSHT